MGKKLAAHNRKKREAKKREAKKREEQVQSKSGVNQYYGIGAVIAVGVIGGLGYYLYKAKKGEVNPTVSQQPHPQQPPKANKFEMD